MKRTTNLIRYDCGSLPVYFLAAEEQVNFSGLHPLEWQRSFEFVHPRRRSEYLKARWLYHQLVSRQRSFVTGCWSTSPYVGSISHRGGHVAIAYMQRANCSVVGVDLEYCHSRAQHLLPKFCCESEQQMLAVLGSSDRELYASLFFSCKEAVLKALSLKSLRNDIVIASLTNDRVKCEVAGKTIVCNFRIIKQASLVLTAVCL